MRAASLVMLTCLCGGYGGCGTSGGAHDMARDLSVAGDLVVGSDLAATVAYGGTVYVREADAGYPLGVAQPAAAGVQLSSDDGVRATSGSDGKFALAAAAGFRTLSAAPAGYIPIHASDEIAPGKSTTLDVALYSAPAVTPRSGFVKGVITFDAGAWINEVYFPSDFDPTYATAVTRMAANLTTLPDPAFVKSVGLTSITLDTKSPGDAAWHMLDATQTGQLVMAAHARGLQYMMWADVFDDGTGARPDGKTFQQILTGPPSSQFWDSFFAEYQRILVERATIAEQQGAEWLAVGQHDGYWTSATQFASASDCLSRWSALIAAVRAVYHGKLTYFGLNSAVMYHHYEVDDWPPGFVDLFDAIGIEIQEITAEPNPTRAQLAAGLRAQIQHGAPSKPIFVMLIVPSVDGGTSFGTYIEPVLASNPIANQYPRNVWQQADAYEALFEAINGTALGDGNVMGVFTWGYFHRDEYFVGPGAATLAMDKSANVRGKPAEAILDYWFKRL